ncbi:hypothetical protein ACLOJK_028775 [Asimina triloba]
MGESITDGAIATFLKTKEGDTVTPGTKVAIISKSDNGSTQVPSDKNVDEPKPSPPAEKETPKVEASHEKPKATLPSPPKATTPPAPKVMISEPVLPPKERERRRNDGCWTKDVDEKLKRLHSLFFGADTTLERSDFASAQILFLRLLGFLNSVSQKASSHEQASIHHIHNEVLMKFDSTR